MTSYALIGMHSDVSIFDVDGCGQKNLVIKLRDGRVWSGLSADAAIEQLSVLRDQGVKMPPGDIRGLLRLVGSRPSPNGNWLKVKQRSGLAVAS